MTVLMSPAPLRSKSSRVAFTALVVVFVTAIPVTMLEGGPEASTYMRNAVPRFDGAPASVTVNAAGFCVNTANGVGAAPPPVGTTRTEPCKSGPVIRNRCELAAATEYGTLLVN